MTDDHRREHRARVLKRGLIVSGDRSEIVCTIRNMHSHGAELKVLPEDPLPERFLLHVPHDGTTYRCVLRWRRNDRCGVEFDGTTEKPRGVYG